MASTRTRLTPDARRTQLLDLGVQMLATRSLEELSIDLLAEEAGISRGLLYHYFRNKHEFHEAVVARAADDVVRLTAPGDDEDLMVRLVGSLEAYVDYVEANFAGYLSLVRGAASGNDRLRAIYDRTRAALTDRIFASSEPEGLATLGLADNAESRLMVRGWSVMTEDVTLAWVRDPQGVPKARLVELLAAALPGVVPRA